MTITSGTQIGSYKILSPLGAGGMGEVWLAEDTRLKRKVALKLLPAELTAEAERVRRFEQEAQAASALNHPNIITVYDIGDCEAGRFIVMELVAGCTLRQVIAENRSQDMFLSLSQQMAKALSAAHAAGITHRDIKPDNIMVREDGYVKVLDFGLARLRSSTESDAETATLAQQTAPGTVMGTLAYMSPEQASGQSVSHPSDIFALGIVLYELATGRHPFQSETLVGYLHAITLKTPAPPSQSKHGMSAALDALILRMLEKDATRRPTAIEVAQALHEIERQVAAPQARHNEGETAILPAMSPEARRGDEGFWVAVLPFKWRGADAELEALAEGLSEDIVTGLSRFSHLRVIARSSTLRYGSDSGDVRAIGKELGARYVMEGGLRQAGSQLRVVVQLVDATTGAHLWTETYSRNFSPEAIFGIQDDLVPRIVSTVADWYGALPHSMSEAVRLKAPDQLSPYEAVLRGFGYFERISPEEHAAVRAGLERAVAQAPGNADGWAMLSMIYGEEHRFGFNVQPDSLGRALEAARRAVDAAHANHFAWLALAQALFFHKEFVAFRDAAERAIALNPMDGSTLEYLAHLIAFAGDWEYGCNLAERARELNPNHPGWYWTVHFLDAYRRGDYHSAQQYQLKNMMRGGGAQAFTQALHAANCGQLGEQEAAAQAWRHALKLQPDLAKRLREEFAKWYPPELVEQLIDGLRKAGLEIVTGKGLPTLSFATETKAMADSSASIAVLPFGNLSPDPDNAFFADGLTEEVIADLSVVRALRVISRTSAMHFKGTDKDLRAIARELDVRYLLEGSVRRAGTSLRITAQLIDVENDAHLWAEKYSGNIDDVFAIQEEISRKIVNALQLRLTDAEARGIAERPIDNAAAYDCYMRARYEVYRFTAEGLDRAKQLVDAGLKLIGENPLLLATRGMVSWYYLNFSIRPDKSYLDEAAAYAARALAQDAQCYAGIFLHGLVASKRGNIESAIRDLRFAREQKPGDALIVNELVRHLFSAGQEQSESAQPLYDEALRVDPLHPLNWAQLSWRHFTAGRLTETVDAARRIFHLTERGNPARVYAAYYLALANEREEAIAVFDEEGGALAGTAYGSVSLFLNRALQNDVAGALASVTSELEQAASWTEFLALFLADGYALIGYQDAALRWLRKAVSLGFINYLYLATHDPFLANVRSDRRYVELLREVKARWEALSQNRPRPLPAQLGEALTESDQAVPEMEESKTQTPPSGTSAPNRESVQSSNPPVTKPNLNSIAVLPFANISADEENEYFCDGLAEELLNALAKIDELKVAARTSAFSFKGKNTEAREIGKTLNVNTVLEGSVRKAGNRIRINVQLVNAADGYQLWSERYDREMRDIFDVQDEITLAVMDALKVKLLGTEKAAVLRRYTDNTEAYQLYLKGRFHSSRWTAEEMKKAIEFFEQAIAIEPDYAPAFVGLAACYVYLWLFSYLPPEESLPRMKAAALQAMAIDSDLAESHYAIARMKFWYEWEFAEAEREFKKGIELNPNYSEARERYGTLLAALDRYDEAVAEANRALDVDPLAHGTNLNVGWIFCWAGHYDRLLEQGRKLIDLDANFYGGHMLLGVEAWARRDYHAAIAAMQQAVSLGGGPLALSFLGGLYGIAGQPGKAREALEELQALSSKQYVLRLYLALIYAGLGEMERAFELFEQAYQQREGLLVLLKHLARFIPRLSADARLTGLLRRIGLPMEEEPQTVESL